MRLTPLDIRKQEFKRSMRGFDPDEVNTFLEMVAEEFNELLSERNRMNDELIRLRTQLHDYQEIERTLKQALKNTQDTAQQSFETSKRAAEMTLREAELEAERTLRDSRLKLQELKNELMIVKAQKDSFARRLRHLLESQLELIGVLEMDDLGFGEPDSPSIAASAPHNLSTTHRDKHAIAGGNPTEHPPQKITSAKSAARYEAAAIKMESEMNAPSSRRSGRTSHEFRSVQDNSTQKVGRDHPAGDDNKDSRISDHFIT